MFVIKNFGHFVPGLLTFIFLSVFSNAEIIAQDRQEISLNGTWDFKWDNENRLAYPPDEGRWTTMEVTKKSRTATGFGENGTNHWAWYRRDVQVPNSMKGQRIKLRFTEVKYKAVVYWNGEKVGEHIDGSIPFEIDLSGRVKFNEKNELLVGVIGRISIQRPDLLPYVESDFSGSAGDANPPRGSLIGPASWIHQAFGGIHDDVDLVSCPEVHVDDFHITTSVRQSKIKVEVTALNEGRSAQKREVRIFIEDNGKSVKEFPGRSVQISPGGKATAIFTDDWEDPHLWSHQDPYLYTLVMQLQKGNRVVDEKRFRFGFREFWIEGIDFYLNGKVFKMRRSPIYGLSGRTSEEIKEWMEGLKAININQVRIHHSGFPERIAAVADEVGMTICPESTFWSRTPYYDIENPQMWENARTHWAGLVKMFKNHPSVVMYSIENEMLSTGSYLMHQEPEKWRRYQDKWIEVGQFVRNLDPTKPLQYSWGHDIRGWAETANIHYVRDIKYFSQYPRDLYWLQGENLTQRERNRDYDWKKDRPLIKGEYGYWYHSNPPHGLTSFIGEDAYIGDNWSKTWKWCLKKKNEAYRYSGATGNPWSFDEDRYKFFPLQEVFLKDWKANFYGGEKMKKEVIVVNEAFDPVSMDLQIELTGNGNVLARKKIPLEMSEGTRWIKDVELILPTVKKRMNADLNLRLVSDGNELYSNSYPVHIFPRNEPVEYDRNAVGLYDPDGKTLREMTGCGYLFTRVNSINDREISALKVLIIGKDGVSPQFYEKGDLLNEFVRNGGRLIILEQALVEKFDWLPYELEIDKTRDSRAAFRGRTDLPILDDIAARGLNATIAFKMMPDHPILQNIEDADLRYWRGTHQVSKNNFFRPKFWNYNTIAYVGSGNGIEHTPLVTLPYGSGVFIMTQFVISDEMSKEPAAFILFNNMLNYALRYSSGSSRAGILAGQENNTKRILTVFGGKVEHLEELTESDLNSLDVLFVDPGIDLGKYRANLDRFLLNGGKIVIREITPGNISNVRSIVPDNISVEPIPEPLSGENREGSRDICPSRVYKTEYHPVLAGITNFDLYWRTPSGYTQRFGNEIALIASYVVTGNSIQALTTPAVYAKIPVGNGEIIIDQVDWETGLEKVTDHTSRIISNFLNNLGIEMKPNVTFNR
ncbi:MAG: hypothetical protein K9J30_09625 [Bacteroidales bacterium]|nr:hypothetical protein [Bacteroidales bacterium]